MFNEARRLISAGKKVRGALVALGFIIAGGSPSLRHRVLEVSIGYEFLHNAFLVHDDIMDQGQVRRNHPSAWVTFTRSSPSADSHYGISQAINLGDMMAYWLPPLVAHSDFPGTRISEAVQLIATCVQNTVIGQVLDIDPDVTITEPSDDLLILLARNKTALYSFVVPLQLGAILGGMPTGSPIFASMYDFALPLGIAFQFQDDILGLYGSEEELGKSVTSDLTEGKKTVLFWELYHRLREKDKQHFESLWGNPAITDSDLDWTRTMGRTSGALDAIVQRNHTLVAQARTVAYQISSEPALRHLLLEIADFVAQRAY